MCSGNDIELKNAPSKGLKLAYYRKAVVFESYTLADENVVLSTEDENLGTLLELHLFDEEKEFRAIRTESGRYIVQNIEDKAGVDSVVEEMYIEKRFSTEKETIKVVNYLDYKENGMIQIANYRLTM